VEIYFGSSLLIIEEMERMQQHVLSIEGTLTKAIEVI